MKKKKGHEHEHVIIHHLNMVKFFFPSILNFGASSIRIQVDKKLELHIEHQKVHVS